MVSFTTAESEEDLLNIISLMKSNLRKTLSLDQQASDGFLSIEFSYDILRKMNQPASSIIATDTTSNKLVGYALASLPEIAVELPDIAKLILLIKTLDYKGKPLRDNTYYILGQICVADGYRGRMVFDGMLQKHRELHSDRYEMMITCISNKNVRSLRAHARVGFETIYTFNDLSSDDTWHAVLWDWR
ncbi:unnamed protein product [Rotaria magnacalcarata]|uniref:GNAT family N-acetyltransferase n=1 Tax=Rotaria magnacalcarata TaxID=392030 RepID=A0A816ZVN2_9BILA|nr:unnamed protein product [Rotaria magnacalcarata]CAF1429110.1 unnamed protein product [Rotaria magnacalcarata]CAF2226872.1 unnamed protein product [Rotaria magnacalcarata]CAF3857337.1 unnamed protein product [Rotaria magnacalcarata]CAF3961880.1 unnamed protein product [Rotaria magnacalcarata]